jgi:hypothetical protein
MSGEESITMAELNKYEVIKSLLDRRLTNKEAGRSLQLSVRQIQRIKKKEYLGKVFGALFMVIKGESPHMLFLRNSRQK